MKIEDLIGRSEFGTTRLKVRGDWHVSNGSFELLEAFILEHFSLTDSEEPTGWEQTICEEAEALISGDRRDAYGSVHESFDRIGKVWEGVLLMPITGKQVALCMVGLKLCREANAHNRDNLTDLVGYTLLLEKFEEW